MRKCLIVSAIFAVGVMSLSAPAQAVIEFSGRIVKSTCSIEPDRVRVDLGVWRAADFETQHTIRYADMPLTIRFHGCLSSIRSGIATLSVVAAGRQGIEVSRHDLWGDRDSGVGIDLHARSGQMTRHRHRQVPLTPVNNTLSLEPIIVGGGATPALAIAPIEILAGLRRYVSAKAIAPEEIKSALFFTVVYG